MKNIFMIFLFSSILVAQNPDGTNASLHLSPVWQWGDADYSSRGYLFYPAGAINEEQTVSVINAGTLEYPYMFGLHAMVKIPTYSFLTVSISYSFSQQFEQYSKDYIQDKEFSNYWKINGKLHSISATISVYNLFSVYQGD